MKDEIIEELWRIKDELALAANYDVHALCRELRKQQTASTSQIVDRSAILPVPAKARPTTGASG